MPYISTKTYGHDIGLSACFRQHRADSHCHFLHGYALAVRLEFEADELDVRNWVVDYGSLKTLKGWLQGTLDHKTLVAHDDPHVDTFQDLHDKGIADVIFVPATGCEALAEMIFYAADVWLGDAGYKPRVRMRSVEVSEHGANSAIYKPE